MNDRDILYKQIGLRIQLLRQLRGISREELAERLGITPGHLARLENGRRRMRTVMVIQCSRELSTTMDFLVRGTGNIDKTE